MLFLIVSGIRTLYKCAEGGRVENSAFIRGDESIKMVKLTRLLGMENNAKMMDRYERWKFGNIPKTASKYRSHFRQKLYNTVYNKVNF